MTTAVYFWLGLGLLLMALETLVPGAFLLWFGLAALVMGAVVFTVPELHGVLQALLFGGLALGSVQIYRTWFRGKEPESDQPLLNRRAQQYVDRVFVLEQPIENGYGKVKIGDALWTVAGAPLPAGAKVRVVGIDGITLKVEPGG